MTKYDWPFRDTTSKPMKPHKDKPAIMPCKACVGWHYFGNGRFCRDRYSETTKQLDLFLGRLSKGV